MPGLARACLLGLTLGSLVSSGCATDPGDDELVEPIDSAIRETALDLPDETAPATSLAAAPDDVMGTELIDVRGVGDSAFARSHEKDPMPAGLGAALDRFDPTGKLLKGDLTFMNWESVVGDHCDQFSKPFVAKSSYAFISRPENLAQAYARGVNLVGLSNNHSRDCSNGGGEETSSRLSVPALEAMAENEWIFAGISLSNAEKSKAKVRTFTVKGRPVRVAFASLYTGRGSCPLATCQADADAVMKSLRDSPADLRILALHSQDSQPTLVKTGMTFITEYGGDVVFGHGPHVWMPVHVARKPNGKAGVFFESLGNFLHPGCAAQARNVIGRALFDDQMSLKQVQLVPVANTGMDVKLSNVDGAEVGANLRWTSTGRNHGVYANIKP